MTTLTAWPSWSRCSVFLIRSEFRARSPCSSLPRFSALHWATRTRLANALLFVLTTYLYWRNPFVLSGAEDLAHFSLLWSLFLPMNRYWSVDSALDPQPPGRSYPAIPFIAIRLQIVSLYFFSGLFKLEGAPWRSGNAILWALSDTAYGSTPLGLFLVNHASGMLYLVNYAVILFQLAFPFLVYCPWRND